MKPEVEQPPRRPRPWIRRILIFLLGLLLLSSTAFLLRKPLFSGLVLSTLCARLSNELGVPVQAKALEGNWWSSFELQGLSFSGAEGPVPSLSDATIILKLEPLELPGSGLAALRSLEIRAERLELTLPTGSGGEEAKENAATSRILADAFPLFPMGVDVAVTNLVFGSRSGKTRIEIGPIEFGTGVEARQGRRSIRIIGPELALSVDIRQASEKSIPGESGTDASWSFTSQGQLAGLGELLQDLGSDLPIQSGSVEFDASLNNAGFAKGHLKIEGILYEDRKLETTELDFEVRKKQVQVTKLRVELPGLMIDARDLLLPVSDWRSEFHPEHWQGSLSIRIQDLEPYRRHLPEMIRKRLPIQGNLEGNLSAGQLLLSKGVLQGRGFALQLQKGRIPILGDYQKRSGELQGSIEVTEGVPFELAPFGRVSVIGVFEGRCTGSLDQPALEGIIDARVKTGKGLLHLKGRARSAGDKHSLEEMVVSITAPSGGEAETASQMKIQGRMEFDPTTKRGKVTIEGDLDSKPLEALGLLPGLPRHVIVQTLSTEVSFALGEKSQVEARLSMVGITSEGRTVGELNGRVTWKGGEEIEINEFVIRPDRREREGGNVHLAASGRIPLARGTNWDLSVEGENLALDFLGPFISISLPRSRLDLSAKIHGPLEAPSFSVDTGGYLLQHSAALLLTLSEEQIRHLPQLPLKFRAKVEADPYHIRVERLEVTSGEGSEMVKLEGHGNLPFGTAGLAEDLGSDLFQAEFHWKHEMALAASLEGSFHLDEQGVAFGPLTITGPDGVAKGKLRADFPVQDLLRGKVNKESVRLSGKLDLQRINLSKIPRVWITDLDLTGRIDGELTLDGNLANPEPRMRLSLEQVGLKIRGAPRVESLSGEILVHSQGMEVRQMQGKIGISDFTIQGGLHTKGMLWKNFDQAALRFQLDGKDLMLVRSRGLRILGTTHLLMAGTPRKMEITGEIAIESGKYNERQSLIMIDPARRGGASIPGFVPFVLEGELGKRIDFDVKLTTVQPFLIRTGLVDADVSAQLRLQGPGSKPFLVGAVTALRGWIRMPAAKLRLEQALIFFKKDHPFFPELDVTAVYRRKGHEIRMRVLGSYDKPELLLTSTPHLEYEEILVFLSTGQLPRDLEGRAMESTLLAAGSYGANELWGWLIDTGSTDEEGESFFDRFSVESGQDFGTSGVESLRVEYKLGPQWFVQVERDADGFYNMGLVFRINF